MTLVGSIETFNLHADNWLEYIERVKQYFIANGIDSAEKKEAFY